MIKWYFSDSDDFAHYDLLPENMVKANEWLEINPDIYYFSYAYSATNKVGNLQIPRLTTNPVLFIPCFIMGVIPTFTDKKSGYEITAESRANDGIVSLPSALYPWDEPHTDFNANNITKGVWNVMPVRAGDHGTAIGLLANAAVTHALYDEIAERLVSLPD